MRSFDVFIAEKTKITKEVSGAYGGQIDFSLYMRDGETVIGKLDAVEFEGVPSINMIEVYEPRKGYGKELVKHLQSLYPDVEIEWGSTTSSGERLRKSLSYKKIKTPYYDSIVEYENLKKKLKSTQEQVDKFYKIKNPSDKEIAKFSELVEPLNDLNDQIYDLEDEVWDKKKFYYIVK